MAREFTDGDQRDTAVNTYEPKRILVTGGARLIGYNFVRYLLTADSNSFIVNLDLLAYAGSLRNLENLPEPPRHVFIQGDICDRPLVDRILPKHRIDTIVHFAANRDIATQDSPGAG